MEDADKIFEILVKFTKDSDAAQQAAKELSNLKETTGEAGKETEKHLVSHRAMHQILHLIGKEAGPEATAALAGLTAVFAGGGIGVGVMALKELLAAMEDSRKKAEEFRLQMVAIYSDVAEATDKAAESFKAFNDSIAAKSSETRSKTEFDVLLQRIKDARSESDALIGSLKTSGLISDKDSSAAIGRNAITEMTSERDAKTGRLLIAQSELSSVQKNYDTWNNSNPATGRVGDRELLDAAIEAAKSGKPLGIYSGNKYGGYFGSTEQTYETLLGRKREMDKQDADLKAHGEILQKAIEKFSAQVNSLQGEVDIANEKIRSATTIEKIKGFDSSSALSGMRKRSGGAMASPAEQQAIDTFVDLEKASGASNAQVIALAQMLVKGQIDMQAQILAIANRLSNGANHPQ